MAFYDQLDEKQTIKKAKTVLNEYSRFLKIIGNAYYDIAVSYTHLDVYKRQEISYD